MMQTPPKIAKNPFKPCVVKLVSTIPFICCLGHPLATTNHQVHHPWPSLHPPLGLYMPRPSPIHSWSSLKLHQNSSFCLNLWSSFTSNSYPFIFTCSHAYMNPNKIHTLAKTSRRPTYIALWSSKCDLWSSKINWKPGVVFCKLYFHFVPIILVSYLYLYFALFCCWIQE